MEKNSTFSPLIVDNYYKNIATNIETTTTQRVFACGNQTRNMLCDSQLPTVHSSIFYDQLTATSQMINLN